MRPHYSQILLFFIFLKKGAKSGCVLHCKGAGMTDEGSARVK